MSGAGSDNVCPDRANPNALPSSIRHRLFFHFSFVRSQDDMWNASGTVAQQHCEFSWVTLHAP